EVEDMLKFGTQTITALDADQSRKNMADWVSLLDNCLAAAGGLDGAQPQSGKKPERHHSAKPFQYDPVPKRDDRFPDPYNMGVNAEVFLYDEKFRPEPKTLMMFYKRLREVDVPEMMASIISETTGKPW